jgi:predicted DCC family thiol-disulfide oxidoreductase YuxK
VHDGDVTIGDGSGEGRVPAARADFLYDGDCAFCSSCARFIERHVATTARVDPWQFRDLARLGLTAAECDEAVQWVAVDAGGRRTSAAGPAAIAALLRTSSPLWRMLGAVLATRPALALARPAYRWVARHRDRMPGGTAACALPAAQRAFARTEPTDRPLAVADQQITDLSR